MQSLAFLQNLNAPELIMIFLVVLLFFGAKRLPELFRSFGKSLREFKKATSDIEDDIRTAMDEDEYQERKSSQKRVQKDPTTDPKQVEASSDSDEPSDKPDKKTNESESEPSKA